MQQIRRSPNDVLLDDDHLEILQIPSKASVLEGSTLFIKETSIIKKENVQEKC